MNGHVLELPEWVERPVLIYGPRKSGSTLVQNLLDGHPNLVVYPSEAKLASLLTYAFPEGDGAADYFYSKSKVLRKVVEYERAGFDVEKYRAHIAGAGPRGLATLRDLMRYDAYGIHACTSGSKDKDVTAWVVKTVGRRPAPIVRTFRSNFPEGKVVFVVRNPLLVSRAIFTDRRRRGFRMSARDIFKHVFDPVLVLDQQRRMLDDPRTHTIAYEHLVGNAEAEMRSLCAFLDVPYTDTCEKPTVCGQPVIVSTASHPTQKIFKHTKKWFENLSLRERSAVIIGHALLRTGFLLRGRRWPNYRALLENLRTHRT